MFVTDPGIKKCFCILNGTEFRPGMIRLYYITTYGKIKR